MIRIPQRYLRTDDLTWYAAIPRSALHRTLKTEESEQDDELENLLNRRTLFSIVR